MPSTHNASAANILLRTAGVNIFIKQGRWPKKHKSAYGNNPSAAQALSAIIIQTDLLQYAE